MVVELLGLYESTLISVLVTEYLSGMLTRELQQTEKRPGPTFETSPDGGRLQYIVSAREG
jgi:hypothetical protein